MANLIEIYGKAGQGKSVVFADKILKTIDKGRYCIVVTEERRHLMHRLLRKRYEDYARLLFLLNKDTEVFRLKNDTKDWNFEDWMVYYTNKAKEVK